MNEQDREETLDRLTEPLRDDPELRLDVRAELAAHIEDKACELREQGAPDDTVAAEAVRALGAPAEVGAGLLEANRRRMKRRARVRLALRALAVPLAIVAALWCADVGYLAGSSYAALGRLSGAATNGIIPRWVWKALGSLYSPGPPLTAKQQLILYGDQSRKTRAAQQRAIWEADPKNLTYLRNYVTHLFMDYDRLGATPAERFAKFADELHGAMAKDPDNARYHYLLADKLFAQAAEVKREKAGKKADGRPDYRYRLDIKDRALLDRAMAEFRKGLEKPMMTRGGAEMLAERLRILGPPLRRLDQIRRVSLAASVPLPDLQVYRRLARVSGPYARLLVGEGRVAEAVSFLDAWQKLAAQFNDDAFTLIDELVIFGIVESCAPQSADIYEKNGNSAKAEETRRRAQVLGMPVRTWRLSLKNKSREDELARRLRRSAGVLSTMLLPALGAETLPDENALAPDRLMDYLLVEEQVAASVSLFLVVCMIAALGTALWRRVIDRGQPPPVYLLPEGRSLLKILVLGVFAPALVYWCITRWTPLGGRAFSLAFGLPKFLGQITVLMCSVLAGVNGVAARTLRRRCETLGMVCPPSRPGRWLQILFWAVLAGVFGFSLLPVDLLRGGVSRCPPLGGMDLSALAAFLLVFWGAVGLFHALFCSKRDAYYFGAMARSLVPILAAAVIVWSAVSRPVLVHQEKKLVREDTMISVPMDGPVGFTEVETRLTQRLKKGVAEAVKQLQAEKAHGAKATKTGVTE